MKKKVLFMVSLFAVALFTVALAQAPQSEKATKAKTECCQKAKCAKTCDVKCENACGENCEKACGCAEGVCKEGCQENCKKSAARRKPAKKETKLAATVKKLVRPENNEFLLPIKKGCLLRHPFFYRSSPAIAAARSPLRNGSVSRRRYRLPENCFRCRRLRPTE